MGSNVTGDKLRALGRPLDLGVSNIVGYTAIDARSTTYSDSFTEAGAEAGEAIPSQDSSLRVRTSGTQEDGGVLILKVQDANPAPGTFIWRDAEQTDSTVSWRGQDIGAMTGYQNLWFADGSTIYSIQAPHIISLPDGQMIAVAQVRTSATVTQATIQVKTYDPDTDTWSSATTLYSRTLGSDIASPCLAYDPRTGHVYCAHWLLDTTNDLAGVRIHRGTYNGSAWSWDVHSRQAVDEQIDISGTIGSGAAGYDLGRLRMSISSNGQAMLLGAVVQHDNNVTTKYINGLVQYGSSDGAASFQQVFIDLCQFNVGITPAALALDHDVLWYDGAFVVAGFARYSGQDDQIVWLRIPHAYANIKTRFEALANTDFQSVGSSGNVFDSTVSVNGGQHTLGNCAVWADEDGTIYMTARLVAGTRLGNTVAWLSTDGGATWKVTGDGDRQGSALGRLSLGAVFNDDGTSTIQYAFRPAGCAHRGRQAYIAQWVESDGTDDERLGVIYLGGSTSVNLPAQVDFPAIYQRKNWDRTVLPIELFQNLNDITLTSSGTNSAAAQASGLNVSTTSGTYYWSETIGADEDLGVVLLLQYTPESGGTTSTNGRSVDIQISDGSTTSYRVTLRMGTTRFAVYDVEAAANVATSDAKTAGTATEVLIAIANGKVSCWERDQDGSYDRHWNEVTSGGSLTAGTGTTNYIEWGHRSTATVETTWGMIAYSLGTEYCKTLAAGPTLPDDLLGRAFPGRARTIGVDAGTRLSVLDGNPHEGDIYISRSEASFSIKNTIHAHSPTPRVVWRSTADSTTQQIPIVINTDESPSATVDGRMQSDLIYVLLRNVNFNSFDIDYYDHSSGSWTEFASVDTALQVSNARERNGIITIDTSGTNAFGDTVHVFADEFAGCDCRAGVGAQNLRITGHSAGVLDNASDHLLPRFRFLTQTGDAGTRLASANNLTIIPRDVLVVINTGGVTFSALRIDIDSQTTFDGFYRIGAIEVGNVFPFGEQYGRGRIIEGIPGTVVDDAADNARRKTDRAPGYRMARFAWTFPTEQSDLFGPIPDPDYLQASTTSGNGPVAAANDVGFSMQYMLMQHGAGRPFVYIPSITPSTTSGGDVIVFNRRQDFLHGYVDGTVQIENVVGDENEGRESGTAKGEAVRVATIPIREIV